MIQTVKVDALYNDREKKVSSPVRSSVHPSPTFYFIVKRSEARERDYKKILRTQTVSFIYVGGQIARYELVATKRRIWANNREFMEEYDNNLRDDLQDVKCLHGIQLRH